MNIANTNTDIDAPAQDIIKMLRHKTVRYINSPSSKEDPNKERTFKIHNVEKVWRAKKNNLRCIIAEVVDIDDHAYDKHRTLHLSGIEVVA